MKAWPLELALLGTRQWSSLGARLAPGGMQPGVIWIHGASLGEARVARTLANRLPNAWVTTDTMAGLTHADSLRPLDHPWSLAATWAEARPRLLVFVESAWWPGLVACARQAGVPVLTVAARPSKTSALRGRILGWPDGVLARDAASARWFEAHNVPVLGISGRLKGAALGPQKTLWETPFLVGMSTRPGDEQALLAARDRAFPKWPLLLAPRHLDRVAEVAALAPMQRYSSLQGSPAGDVVLDTHGDLAGLVAGAAVAFVGGTFDRSVGGHSADEALVAGIPVVHGPFTHANPVTEGTECSHPAQLGDALRIAALTRPRSILDLEPTLRILREAMGSPAPECAPRPALRPLAMLWSRWPQKPQRVDVPVVAVGSTNARGSGKTSTALWIAEQLRQRGHTVGVVTRGHGRSKRGVGCSWDDASAAALGDEGALFAQRGFPVAAHPDRKRAALRLPPVTVIVSEDGLQCSLASDLRIGTVDARFPTARAPLPAGERRPGEGQTDIVVAHHHSLAFPAPPGTLKAIRGRGTWNRVPGPRRVAFAGIGRPADFFAEVEAEEVRAFPDHHRYSEADGTALQRWAAGRTLCTTDRDHVRLPLSLRPHVCWRGVDLTIPAFPFECLP